MELTQLRMSFEHGISRDFGRDVPSANVGLGIALGSSSSRYSEPQNLPLEPEKGPLRGQFS